MICLSHFDTCAIRERQMLIMQKHFPHTKGDILDLKMTEKPNGAVIPSTVSLGFLTFNLGGRDLR